MTQTERDALILLMELRNDLRSPEEIVSWASGHVRDGSEEAQMVALASVTEPRRFEVETALRDVLEAWAVPRPTDLEGAKLSAVRSAASLASGDGDPVDVAHKLWDLARRFDDIEDQLLVFIGLASEWDDDKEPAHRREYEQRIRDAAVELAFD